MEELISGNSSNLMHKPVTQKAVFYAYTSNQHTLLHPETLSYGMNQLWPLKVLPTAWFVLLPNMTNCQAICSSDPRCFYSAVIHAVNVNNIIII